MFGRNLPKRTPVSLDNLKTWTVDGPNNLPEEDLIPLFPPSSAINSKVSIWIKGDSSILQADAVVNAANSALAPGGGICGVLHAAAGPKLAEVCYEIGHCKTGDAVVTPGFELPAKYVIHAVGPIGEKPEKLKSAYESVLSKIDGQDLRSVSLCCISTGIYGYPIVPATHIALKTVREFLDVPENLEKTERIVFTIYSQRDIDVYLTLAHLYFPIEGHEYPKKEEESQE